MQTITDRTALVSFSHEFPIEIRDPTCIVLKCTTISIPRQIVIQGKDQIDIGCPANVSHIVGIRDDHGSHQTWIAASISAQYLSGICLTNTYDSP